MTLRSIALWLMVFLAGIVIGAAGSHYWYQEMRKVESTLVLEQAHAAITKGDIDKAIVLAAQSYVLYPESPLAGLMLKELSEKRAAKMTGGK